MEFRVQATIRRGQIGKPALELMGALTQCLVGLGAFLQVGRADATDMVEMSSYQPVAIIGQDNGSHFGNPFVAHTLAVILSTVIVMVSCFKVKQMMGYATHASHKDASTQYSLKDAMENPATDRSVRLHIQATFSAMTIESGRDYLRARRFGQSVSASRKAEEIEMCVETTLSDIDSEKIYSMNSLADVWNPNVLIMIRH